jgi:hypothetical protein
MAHGWRGLRECAANTGNQPQAPGISRRGGVQGDAIFWDNMERPGNDSAQEWQCAVNTTNEMGNGKYRFSCCAGSRGASLALPIPCFGFGKSSLRNQPFVSIPLLILLESQKKPKQTLPKFIVCTLCTHWRVFFYSLSKYIVEHTE